jgi:Tfp pilus assembly protein PilE
MAILELMGAMATLRQLSQQALDSYGEAIQESNRAKQQ